MANHGVSVSTVLTLPRSNQSTQMTKFSIEDAARTVVDLSSHMNRLRESAHRFHDSFSTGERGFFSPSEDDQVTQLWVSYHQSRNALLELIHEIRSEVGEPDERSVGEFLVAYAATVILVDAARTLRDLFGDDTIVRRKLNESFHPFGIDQGSFDAVQMSLTNLSNARGIKAANQFFDENLDSIHSLADEHELLRDVLGIIDHIGERSRVGHRRYIRARAGDRARQVFDQVVLASFAKAMYRIQEWGSCIIGGISTVQTHVPLLPPEIRDQFRELIQPGDVFITRKAYAATNYFLPGYWPHAAFYIGGNNVIEALKDGVRDRDLGSPFTNDAVALIRPLANENTISQAIERARGHVGKPYDFDFDFTRGDRLVCTEVVYRSYEGLDGITFQLTRRAGRETLAAEDLLKMALANHHFQTVAVYCPDVATEMKIGNEMHTVLANTIAS